MEFKYLFSPLKLGSVTVPNRVVFPGHMTMFSRDGLPTDRLAHYYAERARGGAGLIVTEISAVHPTTHKYPEIVLSYDERCIPGYTRMGGLIHEHGSKVVVQLAHSGARMSSDDSLMPLWAPSTVKSPIANEVPHEMDIEDIQELLDGYARSSRNVGEAGLDGVEIHSAHDYLLSEFLSPLTNRRADDYGGSPRNRTRLLLEVVDCVRRNLGPEFILGVRINGDDFIDGGLTPNDSRDVAAVLEGTGQVDYISVSAGTSFNTHMNVPPMHVPLGSYVGLAANIREAVEIPVVAVGRINDPVQAERILEDGQADMVAMARAQICDPEWVLKAKQGRPEDIRRCVACNEGCIGRLFRVRPISCVQNPSVGHEQEMGVDSLKPAEKRLRAVVVGGGPAGMEVARVAAIRGHQVTLFERSHELGGQVLLAARAPFRAEFGDITRYLSAQLSKLGVRVVAGKEVSADDIVQEDPDVVIVATGSSPLAPDFAGSDQSNVANYWQVMNDEVEIGDMALLIDEVGHYQAYGTAEYMADQGKHVEVVTPSLSAGTALDLTNVIPIYERLLHRGVVISPLSRVREVRGNSVIVANVFTGRERTIDGIDTVVAAIGNRAENDLYYSLKGRGLEVHAVGDCVAPRTVLRAIRDGNLLARTL